MNITMLEEFLIDFDYEFQEGVVFKMEDIERIRLLGQQIVKLTKDPLLVVK